MEEFIMARKLFVTKSQEPKRKDNVALIHTQADVPAFLQEIVIVSEDVVYLQTTIEGEELCSVGSFIAWEKDDTCKGGFNVWYKANGHDTLFMHEGVWYEKPTVVKYSEIDWSNPEIPDFAAHAPIEITDGQIILHASWGDQTATAPEPYAVLGYPDGTFGLLKLDSDSARQYNICSEEGRILEPLVQ